MKFHRRPTELDLLKKIEPTPTPPLPMYLARHQTRRSDILRIWSCRDQDYPTSVATTWTPSFEKISQWDFAINLKCL